MVLYIKALESYPETQLYRANQWQSMKCESYLQIDEAHKGEKEMTYQNK